MRRRDALRAGAVGFGSLGALDASVLGRGAAGRAADGRARAQDDPYEPLGHLDLRGTKEVVVADDGATAFAAVTDGYATVDVSDPAEPRVLAVRRDPLGDREDGPLGEVFDVKQEGDTLLVVGPAHGGDPNALQGMLVVDVSDPADPSERAFFETDYAIHNCFLREGHAYLTNNADEGNPVVVVDVSDDPTEVARWSPLAHDEDWSRVPSGVRVCHDVWVQGGVAYLVYWDAGTFLVDVSDPSDPSYLARIGGRPLDELADVPDERVGFEVVTLPGNAHFVTVDDAGDLLGVGAEAWAVRTDDDELVGGPGGIDLYDVSDPASAEHLATIEPPATANPTRDGVWTTSHNFEFRSGTLYSSWYQGGVKRHDVSDPRNPRETAWWRDPDRTRFWTFRPGVAGEVVVAGDMGTDDSPAGVWTFPDRAGEQTDPPALTPTPDGTTGDGTAERTGTGGSATGTAGSTATGIAASTATEGSPTDAPTTAAGESERTGTRTGQGGGGSGTTIPGFGPVAGAVGVGLGAWWLRRHGDAGDGERRD